MSSERVEITGRPSKRKEIVYLDSHCRLCGKRILDPDRSGKCVVCGKVLCEQCAAVNKCKLCGSIVCRDCVRRCAKCGASLCRRCGVVKKDKVYCPGHVPACFIATAAFGSPFAPELDHFRAFRDKILLNYRMGGPLVDFYYRTSPPIASVISKSERLKWVCRTGLLKPALKLIKRLMRSKRHEANFAS